MVPTQKEGEALSRELTALELVSAVLASGAAFRDAEDGGSAWSTWLEPMVSARFSNAPIDLSKLWAYALARALRLLANAVAGIGGAAVGGGGADARLAADALDVLARFVCGCVDSWIGSSSSDTRFLHILMFSIDHLMQVLLQAMSIARAPADVRGASGPANALSSAISTAPASLAVTWLPSSIKRADRAARRCSRRKPGLPSRALWPCCSIAVGSCCRLPLRTPSNPSEGRARSSRRSACP